ncbi:MAG TPA: hypothetical protein VHB21_11655 [Minicystis sp.]|nr:hypothetical protein [Minicystis sp.]
MKRLLFGSVLALAIAGCGAPEPPRPTGGTDASVGACGRGVVAFDTDFHSTNVSLVALDGRVLSASLVSSASADTGLSAPLSGDVVAPTEPAGGDVVLVVDRSAGVVTRVDAKRGVVLGQIDVKTGFASNPQDALEAAPGKIYVSRYDPNLAPGAEPFDGGSDVLLVDAAKGAPVGRIDLASAVAGEAGMYPRPTRMIAAGGKVYALLAATSLDYASSAPSRVVAIDPEHDAIEDVAVLEGLHGCQGLAASPSGGAIAVSCPGTFEGSSASNVAESGLVLLDAGAHLAEATRVSAADLGGDPLGFSVAFVGERALLATTAGKLGASGDRAVVVDLDGGAHHDVLVTKEAFKLGEVRCAAACGVCFVADAEQADSLARFAVDGGSLSPAASIDPDPAIGLPAVYLGAF